jgi:hypothetical protein
MKISLNGLDLSRTAEGDQTVEQVLAELREEIRRSGKVVTQVALDDRPLVNGWQRRQRLASPVSLAERLDLTVEEPQRLRDQTLQDAAALMERLLRQAKPLGRKFRVGDEVAANNELASFLEDLKLIMSGLDLSTRSSVDRSPTSARRRLMDSAGRLLPTLDRIYRAQARGDYTAIADEVEYDLRDQMAGWKDVVAEARRSPDSLPQV